MTKTGMKAPHGTGRVVAKADIQNCTRDDRDTVRNTTHTHTYKYSVRITITQLSINK